jgi:hypothetical protein
LRTGTIASPSATAFEQAMDAVENEPPAGAKRHVEWKREIGVHRPLEVLAMRIRNREYIRRSQGEVALAVAPPRERELPVERGGAHLLDDELQAPKTLPIPLQLEHVRAKLVAQLPVELVPGRRTRHCARW